MVKVTVPVTMPDCGFIKADFRLLSFVCSYIHFFPPIVFWLFVRCKCKASFLACDVDLSSFLDYMVNWKIDSLIDFII